MERIKRICLLPLVLFAIIISFSACEKIETEKEQNDSTSTEISSDDIDKNKDDDDKGKDDGESDNNNDDSDISGGDDTPSGGGEDNDDTEEPDDTGYQTGDIVSVSEFLKKDIHCEVWVVGRIVGACTRSRKYAEFEAPFSHSQAILIADNPDEEDSNNVISVCLTTNKEMRSNLNLVDNPLNKNQYVMIFGFRENYLGFLGIKKPYGYKFPVNIK